MFRILIDSASDILPEQAAALGLDFVPINITFEDGTTARDNVDITSTQFYERLACCDKLPTTSQPSPEAFMEKFSAAKQADEDTLVLLIGGSLSGTLQCAMMAAAEVEYDRAFFVDTETVTMGLHLLIDRAIALREEGRAVDEVAAILEEEKKAIRIYAVLNELKYLHKGGRLPAAVAIVGSALGIKPVVCLKSGKVGLAGKGRGLPGAFVSLFKLLEQEGGIDLERGVVVGHTNSRGMADPILQYLSEKLDVSLAPLTQVGCCIGTHIGPKAAGLAFFVRDPA